MYFRKPLLWKCCLPALVMFPGLICSSAIIASEKPLAIAERSGYYKRTYNISRIDEIAPVIDGKIDDPAWLLGSWSEEFIQQTPSEGNKASERTIVKVLYDDKNIFVAFRCFDRDMSKVHNYVGRRDEMIGDIVGICFDSYYDQRTGYEFNITAGGSKIDLMLKNNGEPDFNWNAVWYGATAIEDSSWTAEMQIPLSQLRYNEKDEQLWGMHSWRWIDRNQEEVQWSLIPRNNSGFIHSFGELKGIRGLSKSKRFEIMPYTLGQLRKTPVNGANPFSKSNEYGASFGVDGKLGIGSDFTLDYTLNPDFGQVEADPSVMNLSAFETFYAEKRPFFLEGKNVLDYSLDNDQLFYSRRIGRRPSRIPGEDGNNKKYVSAPRQTSIIDAVKFTGKTADGLSVGIMQSLTNEEYAYIDSAGNKSSRVSEPYTNFVISRVQKDYNSGNTVIGGIITATNRNLNSANVENLNKSAYSGGVDWLNYWNDRKYYMNIKGIYSRVSGNQQAMLDLQQTSAHYYQRVDAPHLELDSNMRSMNGYGGLVSFGRSGTSKLTFEEKINFRSPGLELNDMGFISSADFISSKAQINYHESEPGSFYRQYHYHLETNSRWDFSGLNTRNNSSTFFWMQFNNKWDASVWVFRQHSAIETRELRGGPALQMSPHWHVGNGIGTDGSKKLSFDMNSSFTVAPKGKSYDYQFSPSVSLKINSRINLQSYVSYSFRNYSLMYVNTIDFRNEKRYIMGRLNQETYNLTFRFNYNLSPNLSLQYYGSPFFSQGAYSELKQIADARALDFEKRFKLLDPATLSFSKENNKYTVNEGTGTYEFNNPDFNRRELNSNLVLRWEYKPGSIFYLVWSHNKGNGDAPYATGFSTSVRTLLDADANNIFMFKLNYYFSI